jgi:hypothetical protein
LRVFATKWFTRFARSEMIGDGRLCEAIRRAEQGSIDALLGGGLIKQRISRSGGGRSGGFRTVIAYHAAQRSVFLYGFAKNERGNIDARQLADLKKLAKRFLSMSAAEIEMTLNESELKEVFCNDQEES